MARSYKGLIHVGTLDGGPPAMRFYPLGGGTAYYEGALLRLSGTSGSAKRAAETNTSILGVAGANVTSSATTTEMPVYLAAANNMFEAEMLQTGAPQLRMNDFVHFVVGSTHHFRLQATAATSACRVIDVHPDDASGTASGKRYWVTLNRSVFAQQPGHPSED